MRTYLAQEPFGLDALTMVDRPIPAPGPGQVLVRMRAASLNYRDLLVIEGVWRPSAPRIPLSDGVGEVIALGLGCTRVAVGDRVAGALLPHWIDGDLTPEKDAGALGGTAADGVLAEYVVFDEQGVVHVPTHLTDEEAATLPCAALTAWHALVERGGVAAGDTVLLQGTGGVSLFALQFARMLGARVIVTSSSDAKLQRARDLGAAEGVNYRTTPDWDAAARALTGGRGVDHVVDVVGGEGLNRSLNAIRLGGTVSVIGMLGGTSAPIETFRIAARYARIHGVEVGSRTMFEAMNAAIARHGLRPVIDRTFSFDDARAALRYLAGRAHMGKVCVRF